MKSRALGIKSLWNECRTTLLCVKTVLDWMGLTYTSLELNNFLPQWPGDSR